MILVAPLLTLLACGPVGGSSDDASDAPVDRDADGVPEGVDCDDHDPYVFPGAMERCNGRDDDCDGVVDGEGVAGTQWYLDGDGDGFGAGVPVRACEAPDDRVATGTDCDDADPDVYPGARDGCDGVDSDCDGVVDGAPDERGYVDADGDGYCAEGDIVSGCLGVDVALEATDCDDSDPMAHPGGTEDCTPGDEDCDGLADDLDPEGAEGGTLYYADADGDGFGDDDRSQVSCASSEFLVEVPGDCDDLDPEVYTGAVELCRAADQDCDGALPDDTAWYDLDHALRMPVTLSGLAGRAGLPVSVEVDLVDALLAEPFVPYDVEVVVQTCAEGPTVIPAQYLDGLGDPFAPGPVRVLGDGLGSVHFVLPADLAPDVDELELMIYFGGERLVPAEPVGATADSLEWSADHEVTFDPQRLGRPDDLTVDGELVVSVADEVEQGLRSGGGWLGGSAETTLRANGPVLAAVHVTTDEGPGVAEGSALWFAYAGVGPLLVNLHHQVVADVTLQEVVPLALVAPGLTDASPEAGSGWAALSSDEGSVGISWGTAPATASVGCDVLGCWADGHDLGGLPQLVSADTDVLAGAVLGVSVQPGPFVSDDLLELWPRPTASVGEVEWQP